MFPSSFSSLVPGKARIYPMSTHAQLSLLRTLTMTFLLTGLLSAMEFRNLPHRLWITTVAPGSSKDTEQGTRHIMKALEAAIKSRMVLRSKMSMLLGY